MAHAGIWVYKPWVSMLAAVLCTWHRDGTGRLACLGPGEAQMQAVRAEVMVGNRFAAQQS